MDSETGEEGRLDELLSCWQRALAGGRDVPAAELCRGAPELAADLGRRIANLRAMQRLAEPRGQSETTPLNAAAEPSSPLPVPGYEIQGELGRGGMGVVYKARHLALGRIVAIKMILASGRAGGDDLARFRVEGEAIARLQHPNIVQIYEVGECEGRPYFSLEFCPGGSLDAKLAGTPMPPGDAARLALVLARAVEAAHAAGIVHRDLKPANVLLAEGGTPKVTDFGLAKKLDDDGQTRSGAIMGTPGYMAPEQAAGMTREIGPIADVYGLGAVLYEMLVGQAPFKGASILETLEMVRSREPVAPRVLQPRVPRDLETICLKCLQKTPARRYASAGELADDLERFIDGRPIRARPVGLAGRGWRWARRHRALAGLYAVTTLALLALILGGFWFSAWLGAANAEIGTTAARAELAESQADGERRLGETQRYFGLLNHVRARAARRTPGWAGANLADLAEAAKLPDAAANLPELRSEAAACLAAVDVDRQPSLLQGKRAYSVAWHPDGHRVALGERATGFLMCFVNLIDLRRPGETRSLSLTPRLILPPKGGLPAPDIVTQLAFTPDGRWLIAGMRSGMLHRWRIDAGEAKPTSWEGGKLEIGAFALSADGRRLYTSCEKVLTAWETDTWKPLAVRTFEYEVEAVAVLPAEGEILCTARGWHRLEANTLEPTRPVEDRPEDDVREELPGGRLLAIHRSNTLRVVRLDLSTSYDLTLPNLGWTHGSGYIRLAANPAGTLVLTASPDDRRARLWDVVSGSMLVEMPFDVGEAGVAFSPDGRSFAVLGDRQALIYRIRGLHEADIAAVFAQPGHWFDAHPDGRSLVSVTGYGPADEAFQEIALWPLGNGPPREAIVRWPTGRAKGKEGESRVGLTGPGYQLAHVYNTGRTGPNSVRWVDLEGGRSSTWQTPWSLGGGFAHAIDGRTWLTQRDEVLGFDRNEAVPRRRWKNVFGEALTGRSNLYGLSVGPRRLVVAGRDGTLRLFPLGGPNLEPKSAVRVSDGAQLVVSLSADESLALLGSVRGELALVDTGREEVVARGTGHESEITAAAFAPNGWLLSAAADDTLRVWERDGGRLRELFHLRLHRSPRHMKLLPDGVTLLLLLEGDRGVRRLRLDRLVDRFRELGIGGDLPRLAANPLPPSVPYVLPASPETSADKGLRTELFYRPGLSGPLAVRTDPSIDHDWADRPPDPRMDGRGYSVRWTGRLEAPMPGRYTLTLQGAEGLRLWLDGRKRIDLWPNRGPSPFSIEVDFTTDSQALRVEMNQLTGRPKPRLSWSGPGLEPGAGERGRAIPFANVSRSPTKSK